jgi:hypothetical protein
MRHKEGIIFCLEHSFGRMSSTLLKLMCYSNVLIKLFQVVIITSQQSDKCLWKSSFSLQFFRNLVWHRHPATLPAHFHRIFCSKLVGVHRCREPGQFFRVDQLQVAIKMRTAKIGRLDGEECVSHLKDSFGRMSSDLLKIIYVTF